ncbi:MAG: AAA family ATPase [Prevotella sp.]|nr:AAA family ATPase [Prevotella sp.]
MGIFINRGNTDFLSSLTGEYVDKSGLIAVVNRTLFTDQRFSCVTRCRRFGKSMAARMLCAYYDDSCDSRSLFTGLEIEREESFEKHLRRPWHAHWRPLIATTRASFLTTTSARPLVALLQQRTRWPASSASPITMHIMTITFTVSMPRARASPTLC